MITLLYTPEKFIWTAGLTLAVIILSAANTYVLFEGTKSRLNRHWLLFQGGLLCWCIAQVLTLVAPQAALMQITITLKYSSLAVCGFAWIELPGALRAGSFGFTDPAARRFRFIRHAFYGALTLLLAASVLLGYSLLLDGLAVMWLTLSLIILIMSFRYSNNDLMPVSVTPALAAAEGLIIIADQDGRILYHNHHTLPGSELCIAGMDTLETLFDLFVPPQESPGLDLAGYWVEMRGLCLKADGGIRRYDIHRKRLASFRYRQGSIIVEVTDQTRQHQMLETLQEINDQLEDLHEKLEHYGAVADTLTAEAELERIESELDRILGSAYSSMGMRLEQFRRVCHTQQKSIEPEVIDESLNALIEEIRSVIATLRASINHYSLKGGLTHDPGRNC